MKECLQPTLLSYLTQLAAYPGGGVSRAILHAGGEVIIKDAQKMVPIPLGDVLVTTAGKLERQKYVFHCIMIDKNAKCSYLPSK